MPRCRAGAIGSPEQIVLGFGAHLDPRIALLRAVAELNQMLMRVAVVCAAGRRSRNRRTASPACASGSRRRRSPSIRISLRTRTQPPRRGADFARCWSDDLREDVRYCQRLVERRGMELLVLDQTRPDIGLPVVKVIVPGLRHFWPRFAPGRLYDVPVELGWIPRRLSEAAAQSDRDVPVRRSPVAWSWEAAIPSDASDGGGRRTECAWRRSCRSRRASCARRARSSAGALCAVALRLHAPRRR